MEKGRKPARAALVGLAVTLGLAACGEAGRTPVARPSASAEAAATPTPPASPTASPGDVIIEPWGFGGPSCQPAVPFTAWHPVTPLEAARYAPTFGYEPADVLARGKAGPVRCDRPIAVTELRQRGLPTIISSLGGRCLIDGIRIDTNHPPTADSYQNPDASAMCVPDVVVSSPPPAR